MCLSEHGASTLKKGIGGIEFEDGTELTESGKVGIHSPPSYLISTGLWNEGFAKPCKEGSHYHYRSPNAGALSPEF